MNVTKTQAQELFAALNFKNVKAMTDKELTSKLNTLAKIKEIDQADAGDSQELLDEILLKLNDGEKISITAEKVKAAKASSAPTPKGKAGKKAAKEEEGEEEEEEETEEEEEEEETEEEEEEETEEEEEEEEEAPKKKGAKKPAKKEAPAKKTPAKKPAAKKEPAEPRETDKWGFTKGSRAAKINAALDRKGKTASEIAEETGCGAVSTHLGHLKSKGLVENEGHKWKIVTSTEKETPAKKKVKK